MASRLPNRTILLVEPWFAGSHRAWAEGLVAHSRHSITLLTETPTGWRDTFDRAAPRLASRVQATPDVVLASSMMDLGLFLDEAGLDEVPTVLYLHENQLTYDRATPDLIRGATNWASAHRADIAVFNSRFHLDDFHDALPLVEPDAARIAGHRAASQVIPVGIHLADFLGPELRDAQPTIVWNHRWEADKNPAEFVAALEAVSNLSFRLVLLGEGAESTHHLRRLDEVLADRITHAGHVPRGAYTSWLRRSDIVVSTAHQEFLGIAVIEALAAGNIPVVPNRLAYPEVLGDELAECLYEPGELAEALRVAITNRDRRERVRPVARARAEQFDWKTVVGRYDDLIDSIS